MVDIMEEIKKAVEQLNRINEEYNQEINKFVDEFKEHGIPENFIDDFIEIVNNSTDYTAIRRPEENMIYVVKRSD